MTRRRQATKPVPVTPTHRRDWHTLWRRCTCGLTCPCVDRLIPATPLPFPPRTATLCSPAGSCGDGSLRPTLIEYLATVPFPVHFGFAVLRTFPTSPSPDLPEPSLPRAPAGHSGGSGALGGPGSRPCPGSRAGAAPHPIPQAPTTDLADTGDTSETARGDRSPNADRAEGHRSRNANRTEGGPSRNGSQSMGSQPAGEGWARSTATAGARWEEP
jgi:hypothetical protein